MKCDCAGDCSCNNTEDEVFYGDSNSAEEKAIYLALEWATRIKTPPTEEEFQNKLDYFIKLLTNKQIND